MYDVIIIGGGPAGVTAALYTARASYKTLILYKDHGALTKARVDNFYGHIEIAGKDLIETGLTQARAAHATTINKEAVGLYQNDDTTLTVATAKTSYTARTALIATGANRTTPRIKGLAALEGRGVSYCAICDGFFHRGKDVAVIGNGQYALHEAQDLLPIAKTVTVLTNGKKPLTKFPKDVIVRTEKIKEICGQDGIMGKTLGGVALDNDEFLPLSGLFVAIGVAGGTELARKLGAAINNNAITVDDNMHTGIPNLWAAGDCVGGMKQIVKAAYEGAIAGTDIVRCLKEIIK